MIDIGKILIGQKRTVSNLVPVAASLKVPGEGIAPFYRHSPIGLTLHLPCLAMLSRCYLRQHNICQACCLALPLAA